MVIPAGQQLDQVLVISPRAALQSTAIGLPLGGPRAGLVIPGSI